MRKTTHWLQLFLLTGFLALYACKKNTEEAQIEKSMSSGMTAKVTAWLDERLAKATATETKVKIQSLKESLDFSKLRTENFAEGEKFLVVPVREELQSNHNADKEKVTISLFILNKAGEVRKGNLVQFIPENKSEKPLLPVNTFEKMYNFRELEANGRFCFLSLDDKLMYQYDYRKGKLSAYGMVEARPSSGNQKNNQGQQTLAADCTRDWYLTTTYYYSDGTSYTTYEYLYSTPCSDVQSDDPNGGGGENLVEEAVIRELEWNVAWSPYGYWTVTSTEKFEGKKAARKFTSVAHKRDGIFPTNGSVTWTRTEMNVGGAGSSTAYSQIKGWVQGDGQVRQVPGSNTFLFSQVFP